MDLGLLFYVMMAAMIFLLVRGVVDLKQKRYAWGVASLILSVAMAAVPIETHAVKVDLPVPAN